MRRHLRLAIATAISLGFGCSANAESLLLRGGLVWDGTGAEASQVDVLIEEDRIVGIGSALEVPRDATILDVAGQWVMPGLIDSHVHLTSVPGAAYREESDAEILEKIKYQLRSYLACGVTTVLDTGIQLEHAERLVDALESGALVGPRLEVLGPLLGPPNGYPEVIVPDLPSFRTPDDLATAMDRVRALGGAGIKVPLEEGFVGRFWNIHDASTRDEITRLASERELPIFVHAMSPREYTIGLDMGASVFVHPLDRFSRKVARRLARERVTVMSTISIYDNFRYVHRPAMLDDEALRAVVHADVLATAKDPAARRAYQRAVISLAPPLLPAPLRALVYYGLDGEAPVAARVRGTKRRLRRLHASGVPIVLGSDAGNWYILPFAFHGIETRFEFELLADAIGAEEALLSATIRGAELLNLENEVGTIEVGKRADLVVIDGRPLNNPKDLWNVAWTIQSGQAQTPSEWMRAN